MSTRRGGDRRREGRRGHLVLVGAPGRAAPEDADWDAFCTRIGWQRPQAALPDDYEERLAARIFGESPPNPRADDPAGAAVEQALRAAQIALAARIAEGAGEWPGPSRAESRPGSRRPPAAWAMMAVAAVLCVAASAVLYRGARPALDAQACPDVEASRRATIAPVDDRAAPVDPTEQRRDAELPSRRPKTTDAPSTPAPEAKPRKPVSPGALVARRRRRDEWRRRAGAPLRIAEAPGPLVPPVRITPPSPRDLQDEAAGIASPLASADLQGPASKLALPDAQVAAQSLPVIPRAWPEVRGPEGWTQPASFRPAPASASWSLSSESPRWYGVGLPPSTAPAGVPSGLGVIGQLDLAKAISRL